MEYKIIREAPSVDEYLLIRKEADFGLRDRRSVELGIGNSWFAVHLKVGTKAVAMGRIIGDGGLTFTVTDIAVIEEYQGKGLGKAILNELMSYYEGNAPKDAYLSLMAAGNAKYLYEKFGFEELKEYVGMLYKGR